LLGEYWIDKYSFKTISRILFREESMHRAVAILLVLISIGIAPLLALASQESTIAGTVSDTDWVSSTLTVRYFDPYSGNYDELNLKVTNDSAITRGSNSISLSDIEQGDPVNAVYYDDGVSGLKIKRLADMNRAAS
jgi:hypothetical protein